MARVVSVRATDVAASPGELRAADLPVVWKDYPVAMHDTLLQLLHSFEVAYPARGPGGYGLGYSIVPAMLPQTRPAIATLEEASGEAACIRVTLPHMPVHFFPRLLARLQALVTPAKGCLWRDGGLFAEASHAGERHHCMLWRPKPRLEPNVIQVRPQPQGVAFG